MQEASPREIQRSIVILSAAGILGVGLVVAAVCIIPLFQSLRASKEQSLRNTLKDKQMAVQQYLENAKGLAAQISSRSKARTNLIQLNKGLMDPSVFMGMTINQLSDGMNAAPIIKGITRLDSSGNKVTQVGEHPPNELIYKTKNIRSVRLRGPIGVQGKGRLLVYSPIIAPRTKQLVGLDLALFDLEPLKAILAVGNSDELEYRTILFRDNVRGESEIIYKTGNQEPGNSGRSLSGLNLGTRAISRNYIEKNPGKYVHALAEIPGIDWKLVIRADKQDLYRVVYRRMFATATVILAFLIIGVAALWRMLKPLTGKLLLHSDELEHEIGKKTQALKESEEKFRLLSEQSLLAVMILQDGVFKFVNEAAVGLLEYPQEEILSWESLQVLDTVHPDDRDFVDIQSKKKQAGDSDVVNHYTFRIIARSGNTKWVDIYSKTIVFGGRNADMITMQDRTDQKRAEQLLLQTERIKAIGEMAGGVAHNFNNLLQILSSGAQMALTNLELGHLAKAYANLERIVDSSKMGAETVKRLQDFARIRVDTPIAQGRAFDLSECVNQAVDMSEPWWRTNPAKEGINITLEKDLEESCITTGRYNEIFEVVVNLIKNSVEAMPFGGSIFVGTRRTNNEVELIIRDSGHGIEPENLGRIFEPFWTTKGSQGTGMGLASSYGVIRAHAGEISVRNCRNGGAEFCITLPGSMEQVKEKEPIQGYDHDFHCSILLIDDMTPLLEVLKEGLTAMGQTVFTADSGKKGLDVFLENSIDVVVCDLGMEEMNGWQVALSLSQIRKNQGRNRAPFILLTGWAGQNAPLESFSHSEVDCVVEKPVIVTDLLKIIREVIKKTTQEI